MAPTQSKSVFLSVFFNGYLEDTSTDGIMFMCHNSELIKVKSNFNLHQLTKAIEKKICPDHSKFVQSLTYRYIASSYPGHQKFLPLKLSSDDEVETMMEHYIELTKRGPHTSEIYAELVDAPASTPITQVTNDYPIPYPSSQNIHLSQPSQTPYTHVIPPIHSQQYPSSSQTDMHYNHEVPTYHTAPSSSNTPIARHTTNPTETHHQPFRMYAGVHNEDVGDLSEDEDEILAREAPDEPTESTPTIGVTFREPLPHFRNFGVPIPETHDEYSHAMDRDQPNEDPNTLRIGMQFPTREMAQNYVQTWSINHSVQYKADETKKHVWSVVCVHECCLWRCRVGLSKRTGYWTINQLEEPHTCTTTTISNDHRQLTSDFMSNIFRKSVISDPGVPVSVLQSQIEEKYSYTPTYRKTWIAKQKAIATIYGDWEKSYHEVGRWLCAFMHYIPGSKCDMEWAPYYDNGVLDVSKGVFKRIFWSFGPCIEGFKYCKPIVSVDGTWLYGKYRHVLLMAIAQDGANHCFPIAYALVEGETLEAWQFFLRNLKNHVTPQSGLCLISDRHESIKSAVRNIGADWKHVFCIRHIAQNFHRRFKSKEARKALTNMAYAMTERSATYWKQRMWEHCNDEAMTFLDEFDHSQVMLHLDEGLRWGHMTTNLAECINNVFRGVRNLPIQCLIETTYFRMTTLFVDRGRQAEAMKRAGRIFSEKVMEKLQINAEASHSHNVAIHSRNQEKFRVEETIRPRHDTAQYYRVDLKEQTCDCGQFQKLHFPCSHAIAACARVQLNHFVHVNDTYKMEYVFNTYQVEFPPMPDITSWPPFDVIQLQHDPTLQRQKTGRPVSTRIRTEMDEREGLRRTKKCGLCREPGHNKNNCPNK